MKNCRITVTKATADEVLAHFLRLGMCSFKGSPMFSSHPYQVRCMDNKVGWSSKEYYDSDPTYSRLPEITLDELRAMKHVTIKRELSTVTNNSYVLNGYNVVISYSDQQVIIGTNGKVLIKIDDMEVVNFARKLSTANPGELSFSTSSNIKHFLNSTGCL